MTDTRDDYVPFCALEELPPGAKKAVKFEDQWVMVVNVSSQLYAVSGMCSHQTKPLWNGRVRNCKITCPVHGARFDLKTGDALDLPATKPIDTYPVRVVGDQVEVCLEPNSGHGV